MIKQARQLIFLSLFWGVSFPCFPQVSPVFETDVAPESIVAIMPFVGDDLALRQSIQSTVLTAVVNFGGYVFHLVPTSRFPETLYASPDTPPEPRYLEDSHYALTGEYYFDTNNLFFFQLWLWESSTRSLIYTDGLFGENIEEVLDCSSELVNWIFSHIPSDQDMPMADTIPRVRNRLPPRVQYMIAEPPPDTEPVLVRVLPAEETPVIVSGSIAAFLNRRMHLGVRTGSALNFNVLSVDSKEEKPNVTHEFGYEAALTAGVTILPFLGLHLEAVFSYDDAPYRSSVFYRTTTDTLRLINNEKTWSLLFPVVIKFPIRLKNIALSPYVGAGITMPLKNLTVITAFLNLGADLRIPFGPGALVWDLRYGMDITKRKLLGEVEYTRHRAALSFGYQFAFF